ncbi:MAG: GAF domain-containing protein [Solirubrobacteraceae bacterium]
MEDADDPDRVRHALELAVRETAMDVALVSEVAHDREIVLWASGSDAFPELAPGVALSLTDTVCRRLLEGRIGGIVPDTRKVAALRDVPLVREGRVGAYLGVPLRTADARLFVLCCLARERRRELGEEDLRFLAGLAETVRAAVERA